MCVCTYVLDSRHLSACTLPSGFSGSISVWMFSNVLIIVLGFYCCLGKSMKDRISEKHTFLNLASHSIQCLLTASCLMGTRWDTAPMVAMAKLQHGQWWNISRFEEKSWLGVRQWNILWQWFWHKGYKAVSVFLYVMKFSNSFGFWGPPILFKGLYILCLSSESRYFLDKVYHSEINLGCKGSCFQWLKSVIV